MNPKNKLLKGLWRSDNYYLAARKGSLDTKHIGMKILKGLANTVNSILDLGCGEGTRLNYLFSENKKIIGIDISEKALELAKRRYPKIKFIQADLEKIPLEDNGFELIYSAYVLEHLEKPAKVISEAIRITAKDGFLVLIAPNYGAPNRASPPYKESRVIKFLKGLVNDFEALFINAVRADLRWNKVQSIATKDHYAIDWDTTCEPYLGSLIKFLKDKGMDIKEFTSCWSEELKDARIHQIIFRFLGDLGIYPFNLWGPHLVVVAQKK